MATKKKSRKAKPKRTAAKKAAARKRPAAKKTAKKQITTKKRKAVRSTKTRGRSARGVLTRRGQASLRSTTESGDLQGIREDETVDSESVSELLDEGNAFEAGIVDGVEEADNEDGREVHTHEVPEDDVPEEYLDKD